MAQSPESGDRKKTGLLKRRVDLPGAKPGKRLGKEIRAPRWLRSFGGYFTGAYREVRQVRWPNRRATWSMTGAVLIFTAAMAAFVLALDFVFESLFKRIIT